MSKSQKELAFAKAFGRLQGGSNGRTAESEEQDLDQELWDGDGCDIKPWHPLHTPAKIPEDEEDRLLALEALVCFAPRFCMMYVMPSNFSGLSFRVGLRARVAEERVSVSRG